MKVLLRNTWNMPSVREKGETYDRPLRERGESRIEKFSGRKIEALLSTGTVSGKTVEFTSAIESGLKLVAYPSGKASWRHRWTDANGKKGFFTIGSFPAVSIDLAHQIVRERKARLAQGLDPAGDEPQHDPLLVNFIEEDFEPYARRKYKSMRDIESRLKTWIRPALGDRKLSSITKADVIRWHEEVRERKSAITANRGLSLLSSIMNRARDLEMIDRNPCRGVKKFREGESRDRYLSDDEFLRFIKVLKTMLDDPPAQAIFLLLCLGLRKSEVLSSRWSQISLDDRRLFIPDPKNRKPRYVALNSQALWLLSRMHEQRDKSVDWVFPSDSATGHLQEVRRTFSRILKMAKIHEFRLHDCRRTHASILINAGASLYEVKDILGHQDLRSTQVYARLATSSLARTSEIAARKIEEALNG